MPSAEEADRDEQHSNSPRARDAPVVARKLHGARERRNADCCERGCE